MRKVILKMNEQVKFNIIKRAALKEISVKRASIQLNCTIRTVYNLMRTYKDYGKEGFVHGNRNRKPFLTIDKELSDKIINLYETKYYPANFKHFLDLPRRDESINVSYNFLYSTLTKAGFLSPKCNKVTIKKKNQELK